MKINNTKVKLNKNGIKAILSPFRWIIIQAICLFLIVWNIFVIQYWIYFGVLLTGAVFTNIFLIKYRPGLLNQRGILNKGTKKWDLFLIIPYFIIFIFIVPVTAGLEFRFLKNIITAWYTFIPGVILYTTGLLLILWSMLVNNFFESTVRIQNDRKHAVINTGQYKIIRHPGYLGMILSNLSIPLLLGSILSFMPILIMIVILFIRTASEDITLKKELDGYNDYSAIVRSRIIPYLW